MCIFVMIIKIKVKVPFCSNITIILILVKILGGQLYMSITLYKDFLNAHFLYLSILFCVSFLLFYTYQLLKKQHLKAIESR